MPSNFCEAPEDGQFTSTRTILSASPSPISCRSGFPQASARCHRSPDIALAFWAAHADVDARPDCGPVRPRSFEPQSNPVVAMAGVLEEYAVRRVALIRAAHFSENVLIPVVIEIGERNTRTAGVFRAHVQNGSYCSAAVNSPVCFNTLSRAFSEANCAS